MTHEKTLLLFLVHAMLAGKVLALCTQQEMPNPETNILNREEAR